MSARGLGALASGFSGGFMAGQKIEDRKAERDVRMKEANAAMMRPMHTNTPIADYSGTPRGGQRGLYPGGQKVAGPQNGLFGLIDKHEGGGNYSTLFSHSQRDGGRFANVDVSQMTIGELKQFASPSGQYGQWVKGELGRMGHEARVATPMGRHQIVGTTLRGAAAQMGLSDDTVFSPQVQDDMANHLARRRLAGVKTMDGKMRAMRAEWEGFKHVDDATLKSAIRDFEGRGLGA
jgi:hypothetical protein